MGNNDIKVRDLADTSSITTDNQIMVLTDDANNTVKNIKVKDLISNVISSDNNNSITTGTDKKLYAADPSNKIGNLANLTTTNKSNLVAAINELDSDIGSEDTKIGNLANLNTTDKTSVVNAINEVLASPVDNDLLHALKGYEDEGKLLSDPELYNDVYGYAHSTFDKSKFTVVGSPTITSEGIASGFSGSASVRTPVITWGNSIILSASFILTSLPYYACIVGGASSSTNSIKIAVTTSGELNLWLSSNGTTYDIANNLKTSANLISLNTLYNVKLVFNGSTYKLYYKTLNTDYTEVISVTSSSTLNNAILQIGCEYSDTNYGMVQGSIDLKTVSITVDGQEVFSGNKTGIDVVLSDDYTIVGTPTITDGVASGFSSSNDVNTGTYLQNLGLADTWEIEVNITTASTLTNYQYFMGGGNTSSDYQGFVLGTAQDGKFRLFLGSNGTSWDIANSIYSDYTVGASQNVDVRLEFTGTQYILSSKISGQNWVTQKTVNSTTKIYSSNLPILFGHNTNISSAYWRGSINLNSIKIIENGVITYMARLEVPYTLAANGLKIVDVAYIDRVKSVYELYNNALYFGIDTVNQKAMLPLGDLYSLMQTAADGQWINAGSSNISVTTVTAVNTYTVDLSSILPADGHTYECVFRYNIERRDNSSNDTGYKITSSSGKVWVWEHVEGDPQLATNYVRKSGQFVAIVDTSRSLTLEINETALNSSGLDLIMYRRCGGNY